MAILCSTFISFWLFFAPAVLLPPFRSFLFCCCCCPSAPDQHCTKRSTYFAATPIMYMKHLLWTWTSAWGRVVCLQLRDDSRRWVWCMAINQCEIKIVTYIWFVCCLAQRFGRENKKILRAWAHSRDSTAFKLSEWLLIFLVLKKKCPKIVIDEKQKKNKIRQLLHTHRTPYRRRESPKLTPTCNK